MQKKWFKPKRYGWGWRPATWQGWAVIGIYVILVMADLYIFKRESANDFIFGFIPELIILTAILIAICYVTGEKPRWQWSEPLEKNNR